MISIIQEKYLNIINTIKEIIIHIKNLRSRNSTPIISASENLLKIIQMFQILKELFKMQI